MTREEFLTRLRSQAHHDGITATYEEVLPVNPILTQANVAAGSDPESGLPALTLDGLSALGFDAPDQRYLLSREAAVELGAQLIAAGDPELVAELVLARLRQPREVI